MQIVDSTNVYTGEMLVVNDLLFLFFVKTKTKQVLINAKVVMTDALLAVGYVDIGKVQEANFISLICLFSKNNHIEVILVLISKNIIFTRFTKQCSKKRLDS